MDKVQINEIDKLNFQTTEAFKVLRTNIGLSGNNIKVISFTSCTPNEGKSSVSFRSALTFAEAGKKVLYVDADIRLSVFVQRHQVDGVEKGLSHYLAGQVPLEEVIYDTNIQNFNMIFTGAFPPNPTELLEGEAFEQLIKWAKANYDYVFIDCPPLGSVIDAVLISSQCDGAIIILENKKISYRFVQRVKEQLEKSRCRILGVVLNKVDYSKNGYYGKYGKYGKYGSYGYGQYGGEDMESNNSL